MNYLGSFGKSFQPLPSVPLIHPFLSFIRLITYVADAFTLSHRDRKVAVFAPARGDHFFPTVPKRCRREHDDRFG
jgi:hypothetical protein